MQIMTNKAASSRVRATGLYVPHTQRQAPNTHDDTSASPILRRPHTPLHPRSQTAPLHPQQPTASRRLRSVTHARLVSIRFTLFVWIYQRPCYHIYRSSACDVTYHKCSRYYQSCSPRDRGLGLESARDRFFAVLVLVLIGLAWSRHCRSWSWPRSRSVGLEL